MQERKQRALKEYQRIFFEKYRHESFINSLETKELKKLYGYTLYELDMSDYIHISKQDILIISKKCLK
jgi:hypothetical protein